MLTNWSGICHARELLSHQKCILLRGLDRIFPLMPHNFFPQNMARRSCSRLHFYLGAAVFFEYRGKGAYAKEVLFGKRESSLRWWVVIQVKGRLSALSFPLSTARAGAAYFVEKKVNPVRLRWWKNRASAAAARGGWSRVLDSLFYPQKTYCHWVRIRVVHKGRRKDRFLKGKNSLFGCAVWSENNSSRGE